MKIALAFLVVALLTACSSGPDLEYLGARSAENLQIPPDLTLATLNERFVLPDNISSGTGESQNKIPVLAQIETLRLEGSGDFYWLAVDGPVDNLYKLIKDFWASEGYVLAVDEPAIGIMQTKWVLSEAGHSDEDESFLDALFGNNDLSAVQDQYRTRIAKDSGVSSTRIYIAHRGTEIFHQLETRQTEDEDASDWGFRPREPELEVEMLSKLMIYLGLKKSEVDPQVERLKLLSPRATIHTDNSENQTYLLMKSVKELAWNRLLHDLDRLGVEVVSAEASSGLSGDGVILAKTAFLSKEEEGFFSDAPEVVEKQVAIIVTEETHELTRVFLETPDGDPDESPEAVEFLTKLYESIR